MNLRRPMDCATESLGTQMSMPASILPSWATPMSPHPRRSTLPRPRLVREYHVEVATWQSTPLRERRTCPKAGATASFN